MARSQKRIAFDIKADLMSIAPSLFPDANALMCARVAPIVLVHKLLLALKSG